MLKSNAQERREELAEDALIAFVSVQLANTLFELDPQEILIIIKFYKMKVQEVNLLHIL